MRLSFPGVGRLVSGRMDLGDITVGFNVTPAFTNKSFSLGGGVSARIPLSGRLSAEVGVSYMSLRVGTDREVDKTDRSEEHTSELQSLMRISYAVFCLKKKTKTHKKLDTSHDKTDIT